MTKHVCKISLLNSKQLLRKLQENVRGYFILTHPVDGYLLHYDLRSRCQNRSMSYSVLPVLRNARISHIILAVFLLHRVLHSQAHVLFSLYAFQLEFPQFYSDLLNSYVIISTDNQWRV